jgi:hypothetical protein
MIQELNSEMFVVVNNINNTPDGSKNGHVTDTMTDYKIVWTSPCKITKGKTKPDFSSNQVTISLVTSCSSLLWKEVFFQDPL